MENYVFDSISKIFSKNKQSKLSSAELTTTTTTLPFPNSKVIMVSPTVESVWAKGESYDIKWVSNGSTNDLVKIELYKGIKFTDTIIDQTGNTGVYSWTIPTSYSNGSDYTIKVIWLSAGDESNYDITERFSIYDAAMVTTTTTTSLAKISDKSVGVSYNKYTKQIVNVLSNGMIGTYDLIDSTSKGLFQSEVSKVTCMAIKDKKTNKFKGMNKVRVFVGSDQYLSDKWDSGIIETDKTSIYYGGGYNLLPGSKYFVNIQVYSDKYGWSSVQSKEFVMPK
jgi:hypothetical protein